MSNLADLRKDYSSRTLDEKDAPAHPIQLFEQWWKEAIASGVEEPNAMTLATCSADGMPSARIVLLKNFDMRGFSFFTNYRSFKGMQLEENPRAALVFFWKELERQVRVTGLVSTLSAEESTSYYNSRPEGSRIGAIVSPQSQVIESREWLEAHYETMKESLKNKKPERPAFWGGYLVRPVIIEFWQGRPSRLHDRLQYSLHENGDWKLERLAP